MFTKAFNESIANFYSRIACSVEQLYEYEKIIFSGDGANWIKACANELAATFVLDLFHTYQAISRIAAANKEHIDNLIYLCLNNDKSNFIQYIHLQLDFVNFNDYKLNNYPYLINNWKYLQRNYNLKEGCGCSQEGINFPYFASTFLWVGVKLMLALWPN